MLRERWAPANAEPAGDARATVGGLARRSRTNAKLDAHSRTEAVARGRQLGLLAPVSRLG